MKALGDSIRVAAAIAVAAVGLAACGGGSTPKARPVAARTTTTDVNAKVIADYRGYDELYRRVTAAPDPHNPTLDATLGEHMTGDELRQVHLYLLDRATRGLVLRGVSDLNPKVVSVQGNTAIVDDCIIDHGHQYDAKTGALRDDPGDTKHGFESTLLLEGGTWKVAKVVEKAGVCPA
ncbi:MAG: hypothetical protein JO086_11720 [Acidimicrobiia bacterium]|nr:hypothetical protein [Acidimicrobiia bacterium]